MGENKAIVFVLDDTYADAGRLAIRDVWMYSGSKYPVYIIHGGNLSARSRNTIVADFNRIGASSDTIRFYDISTNEYGKMFGKVPTRTPHLATITYMRLLMGDLFWMKPSISTAYYFDVDILVRRDISSLFDIVPKKAVTLVDHHQCSQHRRLFGTDGTYYNAGVMIANLNRWAVINATARFKDVVDNHHDKILFADQDVIMMALHDEIEELPYEYNFLLGYYSRYNTPGAITDWDPNEFDPAIVHFLGPNKPWSGSTFRSAVEWRKRHRSL